MGMSNGNTAEGRIIMKLIFLSSVRLIKLLYYKDVTVMAVNVLMSRKLFKAKSCVIEIIMIKLPLLGCGYIPYSTLMILFEKSHCFIKYTRMY